MKKSLFIALSGTALLAGVARGQPATNEPQRLAPVVVTAPRNAGAVDPQTTPAAVTQWDRSDLDAAGRPPKSLMAGESPRRDQADPVTIGVRGSIPLPEASKEAQQ